MERNKRLKLQEILKEHIKSNKKEYLIVLILFVAGIFLGVLFVNNLQEVQKNEIITYMNGFLEKMKIKEELGYTELLKTSMKQNLLWALIIWFLGTTVIGIPIAFGIVLYRGFCLGYTIAVSVIIMGVTKGIIFIICAMLLQNIIIIPAILAIAVSGFKLYKSIMKDRRRANLKMEIVRHTVFSLVMTSVLLFSSIVEVFISTNMLKGIVKYL